MNIFYPRQYYNITWKRETKVASLAPAKTLLGQNTQAEVRAKGWNQFLFFS